jgi:hypothetical protein
MISRVWFNTVFNNNADASHAWGPRRHSTKLQEIMAIGGVVSPDKVVAYEAIVASDVALQAQRSLPPK